MSWKAFLVIVIIIIIIYAVQAGSRHTLQADFSYVGTFRSSRGQQAAEVGLPSMARQLWQDSLQQPSFKVRWVTPVTMCICNRQCRNRFDAISAS